MPKHFSRADRVAQQILKEIADLIRFELKDPRIGMINITDVDVTRDYSHAKIFYTVIGGTSEQIEASQKTLVRASGFLRSELGKRIQLYSVPQLHFVFDESIERGVALSHLIDEALALPPAKDDELA